MKTTLPFLQENFGSRWKEVVDVLIREGKVDSYSIEGDDVEITPSRQTEIEQMFDLFSDYQDEESDLRKSKYEI
jgi:hypothetical protein